MKIGGMQFFLDKSEPLGTAEFHVKGNWSAVHSFNGDYLSIP